MPSSKKTKAELIGMPWDFAALLNQAIGAMPERALQKRSHIWASELGGAFIDRYLKMHAHPYSNPPNARSKGKFAAGHLWEFFVSMILTMTGVLKAKQLHGEVQLPGLLRVTGKLDFIAGGDIDWVKAKEELERLKMFFNISFDDAPPLLRFASEKILTRMQNMFSRVPIREYILEVKSVGSVMQKRLDVTNTAMPHHVLQNLHYLIANKMPEGMVLYISKDDSFCYQFSVTPTRELLKIYKQDVATMTAYYNASIGKNYLKCMPPKEAEVNFIEGQWSFVKNFHVEYSNYITFLYGYKNFEEFKYKWQYRLPGWNRVFKRCVKGENITPANKAIIQDAKTCFPLWDKYVAKAKAAGAFKKEEGGEDE